MSCYVNMTPNWWSGACPRESCCNYANNNIINFLVNRRRFGSISRKKAFRLFNFWTIPKIKGRRGEIVACLNIFTEWLTDWMVDQVHEQEVIIPHSLSSAIHPVKTTIGEEQKNNNLMRNGDWVEEHRGRRRETIVSQLWYEGQTDVISFSFDPLCIKTRQLTRRLPN